MSAQIKIEHKSRIYLGGRHLGTNAIFLELMQQPEISLVGEEKAMEIFIMVVMPQHAENPLRNNELWAHLRADFTSSAGGIHINRIIAEMIAMIKAEAN